VSMTASCSSNMTGEFDIHAMHSWRSLTD
jgi:hypothetical protein